MITINQIIHETNNISNILDEWKEEKLINTNELNDVVDIMILALERFKDKKT